MCSLVQSEIGDPKIEYVQLSPFGDVVMAV